MPAQLSATTLLSAPRPAARWKARCATFLCLAASAVTAPHVRAQATGSVTTLGVFNGATGSGPNQALTIGSDGNFYGTSPTGGPNNRGTFYRVTPGGTITLLYSFGDSGETISPNSPLLLAKDGNFYGTATAGTGTNATRAVYRITPAGIYSPVHTFAADGSEGTGLVLGLVQGSDGSFYGVTQTGGNVTPANVAGDGTIFRLQPSGALMTIYRFDFNRTGYGGSEPSTPLVLGSDGNFYGSTLLGGDFGIGSIYKLAANGTVTTIHSLASGEGNTPVGALVETTAGNFYGITTGGGSGGYGTFFNVTSNGTYAALHAFTSSELNATNQQTNPQSGLTKALDGSFYLTVKAAGTARDHILQLSTAGVVVTAFQFPAATTANTNLGNTLVGALVQTGDGTFYGTTAAGGPSGDGTFFRLTVKPHPPFYDGEVDLSNGIEYLQFANGNIFGYYGFLTDPRYIYHVDLGYEYVIDAADSSAGVYLYDFKSGHFFYTSPVFPFPYLYDFSLAAILYYYPNPNDPQRYNTNGVRYFYNFNTGQVFSQ